VLDGALDVAAVASAAVLAVHPFHAFQVVVRRVAIGEAVRHDLVDRVGAGEALAIA
jgi:hypothetical protein